MTQVKRTTAKTRTIYDVECFVSRGSLRSLNKSTFRIKRSVVMHRALVYFFGGFYM